MGKNVKGSRGWSGLEKTRQLKIIASIQQETMERVIEANLAMARDLALGKELPEDLFSMYSPVEGRMTHREKTVVLKFCKKLLFADIVKDSPSMTPAVYSKLPEFGMLMTQQIHTRNVLGLSLEGISSSTYVSQLKSTQHFICKPNEIHRIARNIQFMDKIVLTAQDTLCLGHVIGLLSWIPGLKYVIPAYLMTSDEAVKVVSGIVYDEEMGKLIPPIHVVPSSIDLTDGDARVAKWSKVQIQSLAYTILLAMVKQVLDWNQFSSFVERRIKALSFQLGADGIKISAEAIIAALDPVDVTTFSTRIPFFKQLKSMMFNALIMFPDSVTHHMSQIFKESSITLFSFIHKFLATDDPTYLHVDGSLLQPITIWMERYRQLNSDYGSSWHYYKLLCPDGMLTSTKDIQILADAAMSWMITIDAPQREQLGRLRGFNQNERFLRLAARRLPDRFVNVARKSSAQLRADLLNSECIDVTAINWTTYFEALDAGTIEELQ